MAKRTVLLVDDDENTLIFTRFALKHIDQAPQLQYVTNGIQAMQYLQGHSRFADRQIYPLPDLILLDLKMPFMDGFEFLSWIRSQTVFKDTPVVILTGSTYQPDVRRGELLGANAFVEKSGELPDFGTELKRILQRFLPVSNPVECVDPMVASSVHDSTGVPVRPSTGETGIGMLRPAKAA